MHIICFFILSIIFALRPDNRRGFTLMEMLVVMAIIALISAMVIPNLSLPARPPVPPIIAFLQDQKNRAETNGAAQSVFWQAPYLIGEPGGQKFEFSDDIVLNVERPEKTGYLGKQLLTIFYADSTAVAADFAVIQKKPGFADVVLYRISINPFHGAISFSYP